MSDQRVSELLAEPLNASHIKSRSQSGQNLSYIEGHHAIREANRIFGFDGWDRHTEDLRIVQELEVAGKWRVSYTCRVVVRAHECLRHGVGFGQGIDNDLGRAHESAIKEAETDAMKRALMTFGDPFGLALYDKKQEHVEKAVQKTAPKAAPVSPAEALPETAGATGGTPDGQGKNAFGYVPMRWPVPKMFTEPATESQGKMSRGKARERMLDLDELDVVRRLVLEAYGLEDDRSKATMSLFIDWLMNADDDTLDRASAAAEAEPTQAGG